MNDSLVVSVAVSPTSHRISISGPVPRIHLPLLVQGPVSGDDPAAPDATRRQGAGDIVLVSLTEIWAEVGGEAGVERGGDTAAVAKATSLGAQDNTVFVILSNDL